MATNILKLFRRSQRPSALNQATMSFSAVSAFHRASSPAAVNQSRRFFSSIGGAALSRPTLMRPYSDDLTSETQKVVNRVPDQGLSSLSPAAVNQSRRFFSSIGGAVLSRPTLMRPYSDDLTSETQKVVNRVPDQGLSSLSPAAVNQSRRFFSSIGGAVLSRPTLMRPYSDDLTSETQKVVNRVPDQGLSSLSPAALNQSRRFFSSVGGAVSSRPTLMRPYSDDFTSEMEKVVNRRVLETRVTPQKTAAVCVGIHRGPMVSSRKPQWASNLLAREIKNLDLRTFTSLPRGSNPSTNTSGKPNNGTFSQSRGFSRGSRSGEPKPTVDAKLLIIADYLQRLLSFLGRKFPQLPPYYMSWAKALDNWVMWLLDLLMLRKRGYNTRKSYKNTSGARALSLELASIITTFLDVLVTVVYSIFTLVMTYYAYNKESPDEDVLPEEEAAVKSHLELIEELRDDHETLKAGYIDLRAGHEDLKAGQQVLKAENEVLKSENEDLKSDNVDLKVEVQVVKSIVSNPFSLFYSLLVGSLKVIFRR